LVTLKRAFQGAEIVYHCAGYVSIATDEWPTLHEVNVVGTRNVVEACLQCGVRRMIHFSSIHALDLAPTPEPIDETTCLVEANSHSPYALSKADGERTVREGIGRGLDAVILNPPAVLGPHDYRPSHQGQVLMALARGRLPALVSGGFDWVDVRDVTSGAMLAETHAPPGTKYVLSGHWMSAVDMAAEVAAITGVRAPRLVCPMFVARLAAPLFTMSARAIGARPLYTRVALDVLCSSRNISHERATRQLGYRSRPIRETLLDALQWFVETGRLNPLPSHLPGEVA
jgi:dihydroflavonol-4-reductase